MDWQLLTGSPRALPFVLNNGVPVYLRLVGQSMEPTLQRGATLSIAPLAPSATLEPGDVIALKTTAGDQIIVHRVLSTFVEADRHFVVHQGDAPGTRRSVASRHQIVARVTGVIGQKMDGWQPIGRASLGRFALRRLLSIGYVAVRRVAHLSQGWIGDQH